MKFVLCIALIGSLACSMVACGGGSPLSLTQQNFERIHDGMTAAEVRSVLGAPTESKSEPIPLVGGTQTTYIYRNDKNRVEIVLKNDQVTDKRGTFGK